MPVLLRWRPAEPSTLQTPVALPRSRKGLNFREQDTGQGFRFMEGNSRALVKACVNRPASCPLPPEAGCPGGAPYVAHHAGFVPEILSIQLSWFRRKGLYLFLIAMTFSGANRRRSQTVFQNFPKLFQAPANAVPDGASSALLTPSM